ncbi:MAG: glycosyltransferase family 9 protein, partial [Deltaproteobacteria bacterium]|nr:glycosyltransferase family 9 protein [Deltaproteobacteria bacterium]
SAMREKSLNLCGRTSLGEAMGVIQECQIFVTNDSGLMHVASALGVPTVAIFGSTDPIATGPRGPGTRIVKHDVSCAPCLRPECPTDYRCLLSIEPEEVWEEMVGLMEKKH